MSINSFLNKGHEGFYYEPDTGRLFKIEEIEVSFEDINGSVRPKRKLFKGIQRACTHIIYYIMTGRFPEEGKLIDHKNNNPWDNSWNNLREATYEQNAANRQPKGRPITGHKDLEMGVELTPFNRYRVKVKGQHIGSFKSKDEANAAALKARQEAYGEFDYNHDRVAK